MKRYVHIGLALATGLLTGYVLTLVPERENISEPGSEWMTMSDEEIRLLSYSTEAMTLTAQRSRPGVPFAVQATFADGRPAQHCIASHDLSGQLSAFTHMLTKRGIPIDQLDKEFPVQHGVLDLRDHISPEPGGPYLVFTDKNQKSAVVVSYGAAVELTIPLTAFKRLEGGCEALAQKL